MAVWERETTTVQRMRWTLHSPAHHTDMLSALQSADARRTAMDRVPGKRVGDIRVSAEDDLIVVWFEVSGVDDRPRSHTGDPR
jgi:hypothetical protein